jgi:hypothetical protein
VAIRGERAWCLRGRWWASTTRSGMAGCAGAA